MKKAELSTQENKWKFNITTALDLLKNKSFLKYFLDFIKDTEDDILWTFCLEKWKILLFLKDLKLKNDTEIFEFFSDFFKNDIIMSCFISTLEIEFKDEKEFHKIADTLDYIINLSKSIEKYEIDLLVEKMKDNVSNIIMLEIKNPYIKLMKLWFNNLPEDLDIKEVKENDNITINKINYIKIILSNNKELYLGNNWEILKVEETWLIISKIIYTINWRFEKYLKIVDETNKEYVIINNKTPYLLIWNKEKIRDIYKRKIWNFVFFGIITEENNIILFDEDWKIIDLNYIVTKLLKWWFESENIENLNYVLKIKDILKINKFGETRFIKIIADEIYREQYWVYKYKNSEMIISDQWKILMDDEWNYIKDLWKLINIGNKIFVSFSISDLWINWYLDKNWKILKKWGKNVCNSPFSKTNWEKYFILQTLEKEKGEIITWDKLKKELENYNWFEEKSKTLILKRKDDFKIDNKNVKSVLIRLRWWNEAFFIIEFTDWNKKELTYKELILQNKGIIPNPFMRKINKTIEQM